MSYKLVVTDMDGTFLNSNHEISDENLKIVKELNNRGILFSIATGRLDTMIKVYLKQIGNVNPVISCNGALVRNVAMGKFYYSEPIKREDYIKVIDICKANNIIFDVYGEYAIYSETKEGRIKYFLDYNEKLNEEDRVELRVVDNIYNALDKEEKIYKVLISNQDPKKLEAIKEEINKINGVDAYRSASFLLDVMACGVTKGRAVENLAEILEIKREEIIAIGDNHNDLSMLEYAGFSIAMGNAEECVKNIADLITASNDEDGVAKALKKIFNIEY